MVSHLKLARLTNEEGFSRNLVGLAECVTLAARRSPEYLIFLPKVFLILLLILVLVIINSRVGDKIRSQ